MFRSHALLRSVFLGSAVAMVALAPAMGADASKADLNRLRALYGNRAAVAHANTGATSARAPEGTYTILHKFQNGADGANPGAKVVLDDAGNIYGTTDFGNVYGDGMVFKLAPDGTYSVLHRFAGASDGAHPGDGLIIDTRGHLFGTAYDGGKNGAGVVFRIRN